MKASYLDEQGGPEVLKYGDLPDPIAGEGEVVVNIHSASINGADWKVRAGHYSTLNKFPYILGRDFSGVVSQVGQGVEDFKKGDEVFGVCDVGQEGTYAEKIAIKASIIALKPESISHNAAATLSLIGLTAIISIEETLKLQAGEKILIQGGAGGVASFAIQLAKYIGASVITTSSFNNMNYLLDLGADQVIDYNKYDFSEVVSDCDAVFETVGGDVALRSFSVLKSGGRIAFIASGPKAPSSPRDDINSLRPLVNRDRRYMERIISLFEAGVIRLPEITTYPLSEAVMAHKVSEGRHLRGKLVLEIK